MSVWCMWPQELYDIFTKHTVNSNPVGLGHSSAPDHNCEKSPSPTIVEGEGGGGGGVLPFGLR